MFQVLKNAIIHNKIPNMVLQWQYKRNIKRKEMKRKKE